MRVLFASMVVGLMPCAGAGNRPPEPTAFTQRAATLPAVQAHSAGRDNDARAARNADGWLVVWTDNRRAREGVQAIAGMRLSADGKRLDAAPLVLVEQVKGGMPVPTVAGCGSAWLVTWKDLDGVHAARVSKDGRVEELERPGPSGLDPYAEVACAGDVALVAWQHMAGTGWQPYVARVSMKDGAVLEKGKSLAAVDGANLMRARVASDGKRFLVVWEEIKANGSQHRVYGVRLEADGRVVDAKPMLLSGDFAREEAPRVAGGGGHFMVTWVHAGEGGAFQLYAQPVPGEGRLAHAQVLVAQDGRSPVVGWDGAHGFHVAWRLGAKIFSAAVKEGTAEVLVPPGVVVPEPDFPPTVKQPAQWTDGTVELASGGLLVWSEPLAYRPYLTGYAEWFQAEDCLDVRGALLDPSGKLSAPVHVSAGPADQHSPAAAGADGQWLVAWTELRDGKWGTFASRFDGKAFLDGPGLALWSGSTLGKEPAVAASPRGYLVTWQEPGKLLAVRVSRDGAVLDATPLSLSPTGGKHTASAFDGQAYQVVWSNHGRVESTRVPPEGEPGPLPVTAFSDKYPDLRRPAIACEGATCLVVWETYMGAGRIEGALVERGQLKVEGHQRRRIYSDGRHSTWPSVAAVAGGFVLGWEVQPAGGRAQPDSVVTLAVGIDGKPLGALDELADDVGEGLHVSPSRAGEASLVAWTEGEGLGRRVMLSKGGRSEVVAPGSDASLSGGPDGRLLVWRANGRIHAHLVEP
ncbi:MAG: hypothetical protein AB1938_06415 [Myxococcota bacterium]